MGAPGPECIVCGAAALDLSRTTDNLLLRLGRRVADDDRVRRPTCRPKPGFGQSSAAGHAVREIRAVWVSSAAVAPSRARCDMPWMTAPK